MTSASRIPSVAEPPLVPVAADEPGASALGTAEPRAAAKPARGLWRRKKGPNPWRAWVLARLQGLRCPLCREEGETLRRYYFWFLEEQYAEPRMAHRLQQARGFCMRHTSRLLQQGMPFRISVAAGYVLAACADWLRVVPASTHPAAGRTTPPGRAARGQFAAEAECPACADARDARERYAIALAGCLEEAEVREAFHASWGLCLPHFLGVAPRTGWQTLQFLVAEQIGRLEQARDRLAADAAAPSDGEGKDPRQEAIRYLVGEDTDERIRTWLVAGRGPEAAPARGGEAQATGPEDGVGSWSPAFREACELLRQPGCGICRVGARAREEYLTWLEAEIAGHPGTGYRWERAQDLCPGHAWLFVDRCRPEVLAIACANGLEGALHKFRQFQREIRDPIPPSLLGRVRALPSRWDTSGRSGRADGGWRSFSPRLRETLGTLWQTPRGVLDRAQERAFHGGRCPLCANLDTLERRALDRLIACLEDPEGRRAFEGSYGTCVRHGALLLERASGPAQRAYIATVLLARVEVDGWEAEEYVRKQAWDRRHEAKGAEETAWLRAWTRSSGVVTERRYGF